MLAFRKQTERPSTVPSRIAVKVLTVSDMTFFDVFFKRSNVGGNQKSINLNADIFAKLFYPDYAERAAGRNIKDAVSVVILGPRPGHPYQIARHITKGTSYKNWRLNGAAVPDPEDEAGRFDHLAVGDIAILEFFGDAAPESVKIVIVSGVDDPLLHEQLKNEMPSTKSMIAISRDRLSELAARSAVAGNHPIHVLLDDPELEEILELAHLGTEPAARRLKERTGKPLTRGDLKKAQDRAERVGDDGEALAFRLLQSLADAGKLTPVRWTAKEDAAASWDFETAAPGQARYDAKSTTRKFETPFHLSAAETAAAAGDIPYHIVRVYDLTEDGAKARISQPIKEVATTILAWSEKLPPGVLPVGFTIDPACLQWGQPAEIIRPDEPDDFTPPL